MRIEDAQREMRTRFVGGFYGQLVSGVLWLLSAALATWSGPRGDADRRRNGHRAYGSSRFDVGAWYTGVTLVAFAVVGGRSWKGNPAPGRRIRGSSRPDPPPHVALEPV